MDPNRHPLTQPYGVFLWLAKSGVIFLAFLAGFKGLCELSDTLEAYRKKIAAEPMALPGLMMLFVALHLAYEIKIHLDREEMERLRSSPIKSRLINHIRNIQVPLMDNIVAANDKDESGGLES